VKFPLRYLAIGILSYLAVRVLEGLAAGLQGQILRTEVYSIHGFSHVLFGFGLVSAVLFLRPKSSARVVMLVVLVGAIVWELYEGLWLAGEPLDSIEDVMLAMLSAYAFLCWERRDNSQHPHSSAASERKMESGMQRGNPESDLEHARVSSKHLS
jgi:glucose dehydrogenase